MEGVRHDFQVVVECVNYLFGLLQATRMPGVGTEMVLGGISEGQSSSL